MEIRDEGIDGLKPVSRKNDQIGFPGARGQAAVTGNTFQGSNRGGAHRNDPLAPRPCGRVRFRGFFRHEKPLGQYPMIGDVLGVDAGKCTRPDVENDLVHKNAHLPQPRQECLGEMESRGGRRDAARFLGVDRLVPVAIHRSFISIDIGRERKTALPLQKIENVALAFERHAPGAVLVNGRHAAVPVFAKADRRTF